MGWREYLIFRAYSGQTWLLLDGVVKNHILLKITKIIQKLRSGSAKVKVEHTLTMLNRSCNFQKRRKRKSCTLANGTISTNIGDFQPNGFGKVGMIHEKAIKERVPKL